MEKKYNHKTRNFHHMERIVRGFSNHRRIQILWLLDIALELSVKEIAEKVKTNFKTASDHIRRLAIAGLIMKRSDGVSIRHKLTERGEYILKFLRILE